MKTKKSSGVSTWVDPDEAPILDEEHFASAADVFEGDKLIRRGRPRSERPKEAVNLRLSGEVLDYYRAAGPGWQTRINAELEKAVARAKRSRKRA